MNTNKLIVDHRFVNEFYWTVSGVCMSCEDSEDWCFIVATFSNAFFCSIIVPNTFDIT